MRFDQYFGGSINRTRVALLSVLLALPVVASAQRPALKRGLPTVAARPSCPAPAPPKQATDAQRRAAARDLALRAQQAAILGDRPAARDQLRQAAALDPTSSDLAYQLARAQESAGAQDEAAAEYCRFLALAPNAPEAVEAREKVASLSRTAQTATSDRIATPFRNGIAAYEAGRIAQAEGLFTAAIGLQPDWAEAYYNRGQTYAVRGSRDLAIRDFQQYLRLKPEADDRGIVISRINALRGGPLSPATALTFGLVIPGAGQMYTGRKLFGLLTLGAASTAVAYALKSDPVTETYQATGELPFGGGTYTYPATRTVLGHPHRAVGLAGLGAIGITSAVEAYIYARHLNAREGRVSAALVPSVDGLALSVNLR